MPPTSTAILKFKAKTFQNVIGKKYPTVLLRGQVIWVLLFSSSRSIVHDQKYRQISMQKSTRVFRLRQEKSHGAQRCGVPFYIKWLVHASICDLSQVLRPDSASALNSGLRNLEPLAGDKKPTTNIGGQTHYFWQICE